MVWRAVYSDGTDLWEDQGENSRAIDRDRCVRLELTDRGMLRYSCAVPEGAKAVYRHRVTRDLGGGDPQNTWIAGYSHKDGVVLAYVKEDGTVYLDHNADDVELYDVELP